MKILFLALFLSTQLAFGTRIELKATELSTESCSQKNPRCFFNFSARSGARKSAKSDAKYVVEHQCTSKGGQIVNSVGMKTRCTKITSWIDFYTCSASHKVICETPPKPNLSYTSPKRNLSYNSESNEKSFKSDRQKINSHSYGACNKSWWETAIVEEVEKLEYPNKRCSSKERVIHRALQAKNIQIIALIKTLFSIGASKYALGKDGKSTIHYAIQYRKIDIELIKLLSDKNISLIDSVDHNSWTPLHSIVFASGTYESSHKALKVIKFLLDNGADINATKDDGYTALTLAKKYWAPQKVVNFLIERGAKEQKPSASCNISFVKIPYDSDNLGGLDEELSGALYKKGYMPFEIPDLTQIEVLKNSKKYFGWRIKKWTGLLVSHTCEVELSIREILPNNTEVLQWAKTGHGVTCSTAYNNALAKIPACYGNSELQLHNLDYRLGL